MTSDIPNAKETSSDNSEAAALKPRATQGANSANHTSAASPDKSSSSALFTAVSRNLGNWLDYWARITLHPGKYADEFNLSPGAAFKIYTWNTVVGLSVFLLISCVYWATLFTDRFREHWKEYTTTLLFVTSAPVILA